MFLGWTPKAWIARPKPGNNDSIKLGARDYQGEQTALKIMLSIFSDHLRGSNVHRDSYFSRDVNSPFSEVTVTCDHCEVNHRSHHYKKRKG